MVPMKKVIKLKIKILFKNAKCGNLKKKKVIRIIKEVYII